MYFDTEDTAKLLMKEPKDGRIIFGNPQKTFLVDKTKPFMLKGRFGVNPLYFVKWDNAIPMDMSIKEGKLKEKVSPENVSNLVRMKTLDNLLVHKNPKDFMMWLIIGAVIGGAVVLALVTSGAIPIK